MKMYLQQNLRKNLRLRRETIYSVSKACGIPTSVLHGWTNGVLPSAKNLHHVWTLCEYLDIPLATMLFNKRIEKINSFIVHDSEFTDGETKYRLFIEKDAK